MKVKHTPGPWFAQRWWEPDLMYLEMEDEEDREMLLAAPFIRIATADEKTVVACHDLAQIKKEDAHLIAAAPELLAALRWAMDYNLEDAPQVAEAARAAISKAEGLTP